MMFSFLKTELEFFFFWGEGLSSLAQAARLVHQERGFSLLAFFVYL